jgi:DNA polymerase III delta prime subunit
MKIIVSKVLFERNPKLFGIVDVDAKEYRWNEKLRVDLGLVPVADLERFRDGLKTMAADAAKAKQKPLNLPGIISDINSWLQVLKGGHTGKPRSVEQFTAMLTEAIRATPHKWITTFSMGVNHHWYVREVSYTPEDNRRDYRTPAHCTVYLVAQELGQYAYSTVTFWPQDIMGMNVLEAMAKKSIYLETEESHAQYVIDNEAYEEHFHVIGRQMLATNEATDDADGNPNARKNSWYWRSTNSYKMDFPEPSRVLIDVFQEDEKEKSNHRSSKKSDEHPSNRFWTYTPKGKKRAKVRRDDDDDDGDGDTETEEEWTEEEAKAAVENAFIPIKHNLIVFCLRRHLRLRIHIRNLEPYKYDTDLGKRLVLPDDVRDLIDVLLANKSGGVTFKDIVGAKGGGAVILSAGSPGTGKTLTAEVYSEVMERPLYTVQASQLGVNAEELEEELLKVFARAQRWSAICLIDEADVYVAQRGSDLIQNAIVGVFLRTLEYYQGVLFMTTNRSDLVDDAIASRCIARFNYSTPGPEDQARLWAILAETAGIEIKDKTIQKVVNRHPDLSGRDIKNLLKLANLYCKKKGVPMSAKIIDFVKRFKPTQNIEREPTTKEVGSAIDNLLLKIMEDKRKELGGSNVGGED